MDKLVGNYDDIAVQYAIDVENKPIHQFYVRPTMIRLMPKELQNKHTLDIGCGSGWYTEYLLNQGSQVTALDSNQYLVDYTQQRVQGRADTLCIDLNNQLPFADDTFDLIIAALVIHYINDWKQLFSELTRVLKRNGEIIIAIPQPQMTAVVFNLDNYYKKCVIEDTWDKVGKVTFYHHTLHELFACILQSNLKLMALEEPLPLPEMEHSDPTMYKNITTKPWFLFLKVKKE